MKCYYYKFISKLKFENIKFLFYLNVVLYLLIDIRFDSFILFWKIYFNYLSFKNWLKLVIFLQYIKDVNLGIVVRGIIITISSDI